MIETERLIVKYLTCSELKRYVESLSNFADDLGFVASQSLDKNTREAIENNLLPSLADPKNDLLFYTMWIIIEKTKRAIIGGICFHGAPDENGEVEIGYGIDEEYRNQGYMSEAIAGVINWARNNKKIKIIRAETDCSNVPSIRALEKNNFMLSNQDNQTVILKLELNATSTQQ